MLTEEGRARILNLIADIKNDRAKYEKICHEYKTIPDPLIYKVMEAQIDLLTKIIKNDIQ